MLLLVFDATVLVSAGSPHHARPTAASVAAVYKCADAALQSPGHKHEHGNDWAPTLSKRLRPAGILVLLGTVPASSTEPGAAPDTAVAATGAAPGDRPRSLSVLRV